MSRLPNLITPISKKSKKLVSVLQASDQDTTSIWRGEYFNIHTMSKHPISGSFMIQLAIKLKEWADDKDSVRMTDFTDKIGVNPETFRLWRDKYGELEEAYCYAMRRIGSHREQGGMDRKYDPSLIRSTLGYYDPIFKQEMREQALLKSEADKGGGEVRLIIQNFDDEKIVYQDSPFVHVSEKSPEEVANKVTKATKNKMNEHYKMDKND